MKIALLCGGKFAFPSIQALVRENFLFSLGLGSADEEMAALLSGESEKNGIDFIAFPDKSSMEQMPEWIKKNNPDAVFCICFPYKISKECLDLLPNRWINFHTGPLPEYRGPVPIFEVLKSMEEESAIAVHLMNETFDKGPLIFNEYVKISEQETFGSLSVSLSKRAGMTALNMAQMLAFGSEVPAQNQEDLPGARYYPKPEFRDTLIQWKNMHAAQIVALINAGNPWNSGADVLANQMQFKIVSARVLDQEHDWEPGLVLGLTEDKLLQIACIEDQILLVDLLQSDCGYLNAEKFVHFHNLPGQVLQG